MRRNLIGVSILAFSAALALHDRAAAQTSATGAAAPAIAVDEVVVTAQKRVETLQSVPAHIEVLGGKQLEELHVVNFQDYQKFLPSLAYQTLGPNQTSVYLRGVSSGDNANHSGPLPTVGVYFDELPVTTIGGTIDINMYDTARVEVLPGPQGTLYGASSEAGTIRIISNKPNSHKFEAGYSVEGDLTHGDGGYNVEGFVNVPVNDALAVRLVGWDQHTPGYIDNVYGTRTFATSGYTINNANFVKKNFNTSDNVGGRGEVLWAPTNNFSVLLTALGQDQHINGVYGFLPSVGDLKVQRFGPDKDHDSWAQVGLTVTGKVANFEVTYAGGYFARRLYQKQDYADYSIFYDAVYGSGANWQDAAGHPLTAPQQNNINDYHYTKFNNELRIASPSDYPVRFIGGLFQEEQTHHIIQNQNFVNQGYNNNGYQNDAFSAALSPPGWDQTLWLTDQKRTDKDYAAFGEVTWDITSHLSLLAGVRGYYYDNRLFGFFGYSQNYDILSGYSNGPGENGQNCLAGKSYDRTPCVNLDKGAIGSGETHKINLTYKFNRDNLIYFTYSTGYRPGGVNRNGSFGAYAADTLDNFELGLKTSFLDKRLIWDSALYDEEWNKFQFSFLGPNDLTVIENAPKASIQGFETAISWNVSKQLTISGGATYTHAVLARNFCGTDQSTGQLIASCATADAVAAKGARLPYTPEFKSYVTARYTMPLMDWLAFGQISGTYQSDNHVGLRTADDEELGTMPGYGTVDLSAGASRNGLSFEIAVKNLTDARGQENRYTTCPVELCSSTISQAPHSVYVTPIVPRTIVLKVAQQF